MPNRLPIVIAAVLLAGSLVWLLGRNATDRPGRARAIPDSEAGLGDRGSEPPPPERATPINTPINEQRVEAESVCESVQPSSDVPSEYFGPLDVAGRVLDAKSGDPVPEVDVSLFPGGFAVGSTAERARFGARTDVDGVFRLRRMPRAGTYDARAVARFRMMRKTVLLAEAEASDLVLLLPQNLHYERLECVTQDGMPVDISGASSTAAGAMVASSVWGRDELQRLEGLGFDLLRIPSNVIVHVYAESHPPMVSAPGGARARPLTLRVPGFRPATLDTFRWPSSRWPEGKQVILERAAGAVPVRFVIDASPLPEEFRRMIARDAVDLTLEVSVELDAQRRHFAVTKDKPQILVPPDARLEIGIEGFESSVRVPYTRIAEGDAVFVEPELPALAYVALTYPVPDDVDTSRPGVEFQVERGSWRFPPRKLRPGVALIGPVPPGEYVIRRIWYSRTESRWIADSKGPLAFGEGHAVLAWE